MKKLNYILISMGILGILFTNKAISGTNKKVEKINKEKSTAMSEVVKIEEKLDTILIETEKGPIKINLFVNEAPISSNNFIDLVKKEFYNGTVFHRVIEGFVIQGGDPLGNGTGNYVDPETGKPRYIKLEINENLRWNKKGRVGWARSSNPDSASCQFFIALQQLPSLNPGGVDPNGYAVFGQVTDDTLDTLDKIVKDSKPAHPGSDMPAKPIKMTKVSFSK